MFRFVYVYSYAPMRPHEINQYSFLVYLLGLRNRVTVTFWTSLLCANLSAYCAFVPSFCSSGYDFAIPSSRLYLTIQTLEVALGLVGNYLPTDFHKRAFICPSYAATAQLLAAPLFAMSIVPYIISSVLFCSPSFILFLESL